MGQHRRSKHKKARCPECLAPIYLTETSELWHPLTCPECYAALEIVSVNPFAVDYMDLNLLEEE